MTKTTRSTRSSTPQDKGGAAKAALPVTVSLGLHAALVFALLGVTLSVQTTSTPPPPPPDSAVLLPAFRDPAAEEPDTPQPPPLAPPEATVQPPDARELTLLLESPPERGQVSDVEPARNDELLRRLDSVERAAGAAVRANRGGVFAGARASKGRRVVYAVDGSGAMVSCLGFVLDELVRSVSMLSEGQEVAVVLFRTPPGAREPELIWPLGQNPVPVGPDVTRRLDRWADTINAGGRSAPIAALAAAVHTRPDVIFFLSRGVERTAGEPWAGGPAAAIGALANVMNADDQRPAIKPVQFIDPDPTGVMAAIALAHDPDAQSQRDRPYLLLTLDELRVGPDGGGPPDIAADPTPPELRAAGRELANLTATGADSRVRFGPRPGEVTAEVRGAIARARRALASLPEDAEADPRIPIAIARAELLAHHAGLTGDLRRARRVLESFEPDRRDTAWHAFEFSRRALLALLPTNPDTSEHQAAARLLLDTHGDDALIDPALALELCLLPLEQNPPAAAAVMIDRDFEKPPFSSGDRHDAFAFTFAARAKGVAYIRAGNTFGAIESLSRSAEDLRLGSVSDRRAVIYPEIARLINDTTERESLPTTALMAEAIEAETEPARRLAAIGWFDLVSQRRTTLAPEARRRAALLAASLTETGATEPRDAGNRLLTVWRETDDGPRRPAIAAAALGFLRDTPDYTAALRLVVPRQPELVDFDGWMLELARAEFESDRPDAAMEALDEIDAGSERAQQAASLGAWGAAAILEQGFDMPLAERALALQHRLGGAHTGVFEYVIAGAVEVTEPERAARYYQSLLESDTAPASRANLRLGLARSLMNMEDDDAAIDSLYPLLNRREPGDTDPNAFWEAWAIAIETMNRAEMDASAHVLRLRSIDPELGGSPWRERIERAAERARRDAATLAP